MYRTITLFFRVSLPSFFRRKLSSRSSGKHQLSQWRCKNVYVNRKLEDYRSPLLYPLNHSACSFHYTVSSTNLGNLRIKRLKQANENVHVRSCSRSNHVLSDLYLYLARLFLFLLNNRCTNLEIIQISCSNNGTRRSVLQEISFINFL